MMRAEAAFEIRVVASAWARAFARSPAGRAPRATRHRAICVTRRRRAASHTGSRSSAIVFVIGSKTAYQPHHLDIATRVPVQPPARLYTVQMETGMQVTAKDQIKGYEIDKGDYVELEPEGK